MITTTTTTTTPLIKKATREFVRTRGGRRHGRRPGVSARREHRSVLGVKATPRAVDAQARDHRPQLQVITTLREEVLFISEPVAGCVHNSAAIKQTPVASILEHSGDVITDKHQP